MMYPNLAYLLQTKTKSLTVIEMSIVMSKQIAFSRFSLYQGIDIGIDKHVPNYRLPPSRP